MSRKLVFCAALAAAVVGGPGFAQQPEPLKRTVVQKIDYPGDKTSTLLVLIEVAPNFLVVKHTHPGIETGYVLEGELELAVDGEPAKKLKPGETYLTPAAAPHTAKGGAQGAKVIATFVVEKDKPLATVVP